MELNKIEEITADETEGPKGRSKSSLHLSLGMPLGKICVNLAYWP